MRTIPAATATMRQNATVSRNCTRSCTIRAATTAARNITLWRSVFAVRAWMSARARATIRPSRLDKNRVPAPDLPIFLDSGSRNTLYRAEEHVAGAASPRTPNHAARVGTAVTKESLNEEKGQEGRQESTQEGQVTRSSEIEKAGRRRAISPSRPFCFSAGPKRGAKARER